MKTKLIYLQDYQILFQTITKTLYSMLQQSRVNGAKI